MTNYDYAKNFPNDEPTKKDELGREKISHELARIALRCKTPMVIGIYGPWGSGKSSFMEFIKDAIDAQEKVKLWGKSHLQVKAKTIKFNPWEAQFSEEPAVALIKKIALDCKTNTDDDTKRRIVSIEYKMQKGLAYSAPFVQALVSFIPGVGKDVAKALQKLFENLRPDSKDKNHDSLTIQKQFRKIIRIGLEKCEADRLIIFIDDLDRCTHEQTLKLLEALKLYLNHETCVYVIGVDPEAIKASIEHHYRDSAVAIKGEDYLDKIIQIPFRLPGVAKEEKNKYVVKLLGRELVPCNTLMMAGLGDSPRNLKRFSLLLKMNYLAGCTYKGYNPETAALFLLIQWISEENRKHKGLDLFSRIARDRQEMLQLVERSNDGENIRERILGEDRKLAKLFEIAMDSANVPRDLAEVDLYIHLARQVGGGDEEDTDKDIRPVNLKKVIEEHEEWLLSGGVRGKQAWLLREQYAKENLKDERIDLRGANLSRAHLYGIFMEESDLTGAVLYEAVLEEAALSGIKLNGADLRRVNLRGADLKKAYFKKAIMNEADLWLADLSHSNLNMADLTKANLIKADLTKAQLCKAKLFGANLKGANFTGADLTGADLTNANLLGANLKGANLTGCNLKGTYLARVKLSKTQLKAALHWKQCTPPSEFEKAVASQEKKLN